MKPIDPKLAVTEADPAARAANFLRAYADLPTGASIETTGGFEARSQEPAIAFRFNDDDTQLHCFTINEARQLVALVMNTFDVVGTPMPNVGKFLKSILESCDEIEAYFDKTKSTSQ